jgi:hypothetical protein
VILRNRACLALTTPWEALDRRLAPTLLFLLLSTPSEPRSTAMKKKLTLNTKTIQKISKSQLAKVTGGLQLNGSY